jgi:4-diphosphocytidyl-2-C-methyl-D-erythritol kinase
MKIKSYAKVNLILRVFAKKRKLHPILSLIDKINLYDVIDINLNDTGHVETFFSNKKIGKENNTVYKAIMLLKAKTKFKEGVSVSIKKNIPLESGLGGGSSNAAAVLKYLVKKLKLKVSKAELFKLALEIGSDVPAFLVDGSVLINGFGEKVEAIKLNDYGSILLIKPRFGISSKDAYNYFDKAKIKSNINLKSFKIKIKKESIDLIMSNDLEFPIINNVKEIKKLYQDLAKFKFNKIMMSGSGSTVFAISKDIKELNKAKKQLENKYEFVSINKRVKTR